MLVLVLVLVLRAQRVRQFVNDSAQRARRLADPRDHRRTAHTVGGRLFEAPRRALWSTARRRGRQGQGEGEGEGHGERDRTEEIPALLGPRAADLLLGQQQ